MRVVAETPDGDDRLYLTIRYFLGLLELVDYIHEAGTTHRDLNTGQVRIDNNNKVLLEGFINARPKVEPRNIANVVNFPYMSPEQLMGAAPADRKTDIYSAGVVLFELITGVLPYESNYSKVEDIRQGIIPSPSLYKMDVPTDLEAIIMKALAPRTSRYRHVRELMADLETFYNRRSIRYKLKDFSHTLRSLIGAKTP